MTVLDGSSDKRKLHGLQAGGWNGDTPKGQDSGGALRASRYMTELTRHLAHCR